MKRNVKTFKASEITEKQINQIKKIATSRYSKNIYHTYFEWMNMNTIKKSLRKHDYVALGEDWFLFYLVSDNEVQFCEWVAADNKENKTKQTLEMLSTFRKILIENKSKKFSAGCRHDTSYPFYQKLLEKGYIKQHSNIIDIDYCTAPPLVQHIADSPRVLRDFLAIKEIQENPNYLKYFLHQVNFTVTDKFVAKYSKKSKIKQ